MDKNVHEKIARMILQSKMTVVLTGAGISTESGIPDFRSPGTGLWEKMDPMEALSTDVLYGNPVKFYNEGFKILTSMKDSKPNDAHYILSRMEEEGLISCIITQNIDNLHYEAGSKNVLEVHGHTRYGHCLECGKIYDLSVMKEKIENGEIPPRCTCSGVIRPDVVLFGDSLPPCFEEALKMAKKCSLMIVIGSSLAVAPVNYLPSLAKELVIINLGDTQYDNVADVIYREKASSALKKIYGAIQEIRNNEKRQ